MTYGTHPFGSATYGGSVADFKVSFNIDKTIDDQPMIAVSDLVDKALIEHFNRYPEELQFMDRRRFEVLVAELFKGYGYEVELTQRTRDGGKDIIAIRHHIVSEKFIVECKRPDPQNKVGVRAVRELIGVKDIENATKAILVTTAYFSHDAQVLLDRHKWEVEGKDYIALKSWIEQYLKLGLQ